MEITIKGEAQELAALITAIKERPTASEIADEITEGILRCASFMQDALEGDMEREEVPHGEESGN